MDLLPTYLTNATPHIIQYHTYSDYQTVHLNPQSQYLHSPVYVYFLLPIQPTLHVHPTIGMAYWIDTTTLHSDRHNYTADCHLYSLISYMLNHQTNKYWEYDWLDPESQWSQYYSLFHHCLWPHLLTTV